LVRKGPLYFRRERDGPLRNTPDFLSLRLSILGGSYGAGFSSPYASINRELLRSWSILYPEMPIGKTLAPQARENFTKMRRQYDTENK
jgi:hypothetical protein